MSRSTMIIFLIGIPLLIYGILTVSGNKGHRDLEITLDAVTIVSMRTV